MELAGSDRDMREAGKAGCASPSAMVVTFPFLTASMMPSGQRLSRGFAITSPLAGPAYRSRPGFRWERLVIATTVAHARISRGVFVAPHGPHPLHGLVRPAPRLHGNG